MKNSKQGFTLVEIMIVVLIIGMLAAIAIPSFLKARETSQKNACIGNMHQLYSAVELCDMEGEDATDVTKVEEYLRGKWENYKCRGEEYELPDLGVAPVCPNIDDYDDHVLVVE